jgi:hypothetical protein
MGRLSPTSQTLTLVDEPPRNAIRKEVRSLGANPLKNRNVHLISSKESRSSCHRSSQASCIDSTASLHSFRNRSINGHPC